jgi:uncharacterized protein (TIGR03545 family)
MIRTKGVIASVIVIVLVVVFNLVFLNPLVKMALVAAGQAVFKAKVEIASIDIWPFKSKALIKGLVIADKAHELRNLFEAEEIDTNFQVLQLFRMKLIVDKIAVINLAAGTDRKTSGFLPQKNDNTGNPGGVDAMKQKLDDKAGKDINKLPDTKQTDIAGKLKNIDVKKYIKKENLLTYKKIQESEAGIKAEKDKVAVSINALKLDENIRKTQDAASNLKEIKISGAKDIPQAKQRLEDLNNIKTGLESVSKGISSAKTSAGGFYDYAKNAQKEIEDAKDQDVKDIMSKFDVNVIDAGSLERALIGPVWYERVNKALEIAALAKKYLPPMKKKGNQKIIERKRGAGRDIVFVADLPDLWIKDIEVTTKGSTDKYMITGSIKDITTGQAVIGKPIVFKLSMEKGGVVFGAEGRINHISEVNDSYTIYAKNLPPALSGIKDMDYGSVKMKNAVMDYRADVRSTDPETSVTGSALLKKMGFECADKNNISYQVLSALDSLKISFAVKQSSSGTNIAISSDAMQAIKKGLDKIYGSKVTEAKEKAKKEIENVLKNETKGLTKTIGDSSGALQSQVKGYDDKEKGVSGQIDRQKADIEKKIANAAGGSAGGALKSLKGLFGK